MSSRRERQPNSASAATPEVSIDTAKIISRLRSLSANCLAQDGAQNVAGGEDRQRQRDLVEADVIGDCKNVAKYTIVRP